MTPADGRAHAVEIDGLRVVRGATVVLDGLCLTLRAGAVIGLLGPSGCGKTTLLRAIVGVQIVEGGAVTVLGRPAGEPGLRHRVAYATQAASVYDDLGVRENLDYFAAVLGAPATDVDRVLAQVGLTEHAASVVGRLSGGERSRVSLAVALLGTPELIVLDEPTVGLDPALRAELGTCSTPSPRRAPRSSSSHVMDEATRCDELVLMRDGAVIAHEPPAALLERTGTADVEQAFLALVGATEAAG